jgi:hypothetical protein
MCQIRAKIYQDEINANIDYARECFYSNNILNNQLDEMEIEDLEEASIRDEKCSMLTTENNIELEEEWHKVVENWIELLDDDTDLCEIDEESNDDNILNSLLTVFVENLDNNICQQISDLKHPTEDKLAKWDLCDLFVLDLEAPDYFNML